MWWLRIVRLQLDRVPVLEATGLAMVCDLVQPVNVELTDHGGYLERS